MLTKNNKDTDKSLKTDPKPLIFAGLLVIFLFFGGLAAWSYFLPFSGAVIAPGTVEISQEKKTVQHLEGGIIDKILVQQGDVVEKGQTLIILKRATVDASVSLMSGQIWTKMAQMARLQAETRMDESIKWPASLQENSNTADVYDAIQKEEDIFLSRRMDLTGQISLLNSQIEQLKQQVEGANEELKAQYEIKLTYEEEIIAKQALFDEEYLDKSQLLLLKRQLAESKGRAGKLKQNIAEINQKTEEFKMRIVNLHNKYKEEAISELGDVQNQIFELQEKLRPSEDARHRLTITAPITGEIINLRFHSEDSGVIQPGQPILDIVPQNAQLVISAKVSPDKITKIKKGQTTRVALSAFNRRTTPPVMGELIYISAAQVKEQTPRGEMSYYLVHVDVPESELTTIGAYLYPGMPVVCYIETDIRTIFGYLLEPILQVVDQSLRES
ncbi:MAG: HlyD family type I secretion periplasmic adaptor subunit [Desulfobacteraceae bacterium]|jgi:HlyD family type I secretion membrane fusion protein|nr:HlyD family type I secretion periplasmic adaptor subunit [Desulfobacteraceae bacterium]